MMTDHTQNCAGLGASGEIGTNNDPFRGEQRMSHGA